MSHNGDAHAHDPPLFGAPRGIKMPTARNGRQVLSLALAIAAATAAAVASACLTFRSGATPAQAAMSWVLGLGAPALVAVITIALTWPAPPVDRPPPRH